MVMIGPRKTKPASAGATIPKSNNNTAPPEKPASTPCRTRAQCAKYAPTAPDAIAKPTAMIASKTEPTFGCPSAIRMYTSFMHNR